MAFVVNAAIDTVNTAKDAIGQMAKVFTGHTCEKGHSHISPEDAKKCTSDIEGLETKIKTLEEEKSELKIAHARLESEVKTLQQNISTMETAHARELAHVSKVCVNL